jgi:hypothetical protein
MTVNVHEGHQFGNPRQRRHAERKRRRQTSQRLNGLTRLLIAPKTAKTKTKKRAKKVKQLPGKCKAFLVRELYHGSEVTPP